MVFIWKPYLSFFGVVLLVLLFEKVPNKELCVSAKLNVSLGGRPILNIPVKIPASNFQTLPNYMVWKPWWFFWGSLYHFKLFVENSYCICLSRQRFQHPISNHKTLCFEEIWCVFLEVAPCMLNCLWKKYWCTTVKIRTSNFQPCFQTFCFGRSGAFFEVASLFWNLFLGNIVMYIYPSNLQPYLNKGECLGNSSASLWGVVQLFNFCVSYSSKLHSQSNESLPKWKSMYFLYPLWMGVSRYVCTNAFFVSCHIYEIYIHCDV